MSDERKAELIRRRSADEDKEKLLGLDYLVFANPENDTPVAAFSSVSHAVEYVDKHYSNGVVINAWDWFYDSYTTENHSDEDRVALMKEQGKLSNPT